MKKYNIYFELYGKKMKTTVSAENEDEAKNFIKNKIKFNKIEKKLDIQTVKDFIVDMLSFMSGKK